MHNPMIALVANILSTMADGLRSESEKTARAAQNIHIEHADFHFHGLDPVAVTAEVDRIIAEHPQMRPRRFLAAR